MSAPRDLDEIPESKRYAAPQYRSPQEQACVDMIRHLTYAPYRDTESEVMPPELSKPRPSDMRPVSATLAERLELRNKDCEEQIAAALRRFTYIGFDRFCEAIKYEDRKGLWKWAHDYGLDSSSS